MIITNQIIRDKLFFNGPSTFRELTIILGVDQNHVQLALLELEEQGQVSYNAERGEWACLQKVE